MDVSATHIFVLVAIGSFSWIPLTILVLHLLARVGIGEGSPYTRPEDASQRLIQGELTIPVATLVLVAIFWAGTLFI